MAHLCSMQAKDFDGTCRRVLRDYALQAGHAGMHLWGDILSLYYLTMWDDDWTYLEKAQALRECATRSHVYCYMHERLCEVWAMLPDFDVSGPPCQDYSLAGNLLGLEGPRNKGVLAWGRYHRHVNSILYDQLRNVDTVEII
eukprot:751073-Karenia_brevis.AAC.1